jgi:hypothetical protein
LDESQKKERLQESRGLGNPALEKNAGKRRDIAYFYEIFLKGFSHLPLEAPGRKSPFPFGNSETDPGGPGIPVERSATVIAPRVVMNFFANCLNPVQGVYVSPRLSYEKAADGGRRPRSLEYMVSNLDLRHFRNSSQGSAR